MSKVPGYGNLVPVVSIDYSQGDFRGARVPQSAALFLENSKCNFFYGSKASRVSTQNNDEDCFYF
jgi:hypothetical protein